MPGSPTNLDGLREHLLIYVDLYCTGDLDNQRRAVMNTLCAVNDYLQAQNFPPDVLQMVMRPALALAEREGNTLDRMFAERERGGRPNVSLAELERAGILASFANAWLRRHQGDGRLQGSKLAEAARNMRGGWLGAVTRAQMKAARELVSQETKDHPSVEIAAVFDDFFAECERQAGPAGAFQMMVRFVNQHSGSHSGIWKTPRISPTRDG